MQFIPPQNVSVICPICGTKWVTGLENQKGFNCLNCGEHITADEIKEQNKAEVN
jgi:transposase